MGKGDRPEHSAPPELFYNDHEAVKYTTSSRIIEIQEKLTHRALELLLLEDNGCPKLILDIGCGSGLSGQVLTEQGVHPFKAHHTTSRCEWHSVLSLQRNLRRHNLGLSLWTVQHSNTPDDDNCQAMASQYHILYYHWHST
jgi:hypothetical protein